MMKYLIKEAFLVALSKFHFPVVLSTSTLCLFLIDLALVFSRNSGKKEVLSLFTEQGQQK